jgi:hypothetical protein
MSVISDASMLLRTWCRNIHQKVDLGGGDSGWVRESCRVAIEALNRDGMLAPEWSCDEAVDLMWTMLSIRNWEQLTIECGWPQDRYIGRMQELLKLTLVRGHQET